MKNIFIAFCFCITLNNSGVAQTPIKKGVVKVQKKGHLSKIFFDDVNYRLIGVDIYGNIMDTAVIEFKMFVTIKGVFYKTTTLGPNLSREMAGLIERRDSKTVLIFKDIKAKDRNGTIINMSDFTYSFPYNREEE